MATAEEFIKMTGFTQDVLDRRGKATVGGNPHRFIELVGGREVLYQSHEPDPATTREFFYYNTRNNMLFKRVETTNPITNKKKSLWLAISEC